MSASQPLPLTSRWFVAEQIGAALMLRFTQADLRDEDTVRGLRQQVLGLLEGQVHPRLGRF